MEASLQLYLSCIPCMQVEKMYVDKLTFEDLNTLLVSKGFHKATGNVSRRVQGARPAVYGGGGGHGKSCVCAHKVIYSLPDNL